MDNPHFRHFVQQVSGDLESLKGELEKVKEFIRYNEVSPSSPGKTGIYEQSIPFYAQQRPKGSSFGSKLNYSFRQPKFGGMATGGTREKDLREVERASVKIIRGSEHN